MPRRSSRRRRWLRLLAAIAAALVLAPVALAALLAGGMMIGGMVIAAVVTVLVVACVVVVLAAVAVALFGATLAAPFLLTRWLLQALFGARTTAVAVSTRRRAPAPAADTSPEGVLRRRYAAGALSEREFRTRLVDLLKEQYVRREIDTWEFEERLDRILRVPDMELLAPRREQPERLQAHAARRLA